MRGKKSSTEDKILRGTINTTREKKNAALATNTDPDISEYLNKIKTMLDFLWVKINTANIQDDVELLEKYSRQFIMWQKHYFTYKNLAPKKIDNEDIISKLISNKEL